jgi:hypothetical protein
MKKSWVLAVVIVAIVAVSGISFGAEKSVKFTGYLSDVACGSGGKSADGFNLKTEPEKHTVGCMLQPGCAASGYGILINQGKAAEKNYMFVKFDQKGSDLGAALLKKTKKKDHISIVVQGVKEGDMIKVKSLKEIRIKQKDDDKDTGGA